MQQDLSKGLLKSGSSNNAYSLILASKQMDPRTHGDCGGIEIELLDEEVKKHGVGSVQTSRTLSVGRKRRIREIKINKNRPAASKNSNARFFSSSATTGKNCIDLALSNGLLMS